MAAHSCAAPLGCNPLAVGLRRPPRPSSSRLADPQSQHFSPRLSVMGPPLPVDSCDRGASPLAMLAIRCEVTTDVGRARLRRRVTLGSRLCGAQPRTGWSPCQVGARSVTTTHRAVSTARCRTYEPARRVTLSGPPTRLAVLDDTRRGMRYNRANAYRLLGRCRKKAVGSRCVPARRASWVGFSIRTM